MCTKTKSAVSIMNESLRKSQVSMPRTELERVQLIRCAMAMYAKTGRSDLLTAARMLADSTKSPALWHKIIERDLGYSVPFFPDANPADLVAPVAQVSSTGAHKLSQLFVWSMVAVTMAVIVGACVHG